jgi:hypothetical protein
MGRDGVWNFEMRCYCGGREGGILERALMNPEALRHRGKTFWLFSLCVSVSVVQIVISEDLCGYSPIGGISSGAILRNA